MTIAIAGVGMATAQGPGTELARRAAPLPASPALWPRERDSCSMCRPCPGVQATVTGAARWNALARIALADCFGAASPSPDTPLVVASCNGGAHDMDPAAWDSGFASDRLLAGTPWERRRVPVVSSSCVSGLHAVAIAKALVEGGADEVVVLAVDILSRASLDDYESLRVLADVCEPWQSSSVGFVPGEAAVAMRIRRSDAGVAVAGPVLGIDHGKPEGGLGMLLDRVSGARSIWGQGTGPFAADVAELTDLAHIDRNAVLTSTLPAFGHTQGCSALLALALAAAGIRGPLTAIGRPTAHDGRPLASETTPLCDPVIACRALSGACAVAAIGRARVEPLAARQGAPIEIGPLHLPVLRTVADQARERRPASPPELIAAVLEAPLLPPPRARIGGRVLPSAVLEMTPGFVPLLVARCWGYQGAAVALVGADPDHPSVEAILRALNPTRNGVVLYVRGCGDEREVKWREQR